MGYNERKTPLDIFLEYTGIYRESREMTPAMEWGLELESWVADQFCKRHGCEVDPGKFEIHPEFNFVGGHADFYLQGTTEILETKTTNTERYDSYLPPSVAWQCQHYMLVHGCTVSHVFIAVLHRTEFIYYRVESDARMQQAMLDVYQDFWRCVETCTPPIPRNSSDFGRLHVETRDSVAIANQKQRGMLSRFLEVKEQLEILGEEKKSLDEELKWSFGDSQRVEFPEHVATWSPVRSSRFNSGLFKQENPEIYAKYIQPSSYRRFQIRNKQRKAS
jgi:predicted phage-related endonuclease